MKANIDPNQLRESLERHRGEPNVSPEDYQRRLRIRTGESVANRRAVYLDTKYWIYLRDAYLDLPQHPAHTELLEQLVKLVTMGEVFCPLSATTFIELLKQSVPQSRAATARIVDTLSLGVSLCAEPERAATEVAYLFHEHSGRLLALHPRRELVWVRLPFVFGAFLPETSTEIVGDARVLDKSFLDHLWTKSLVEMLEYLPVEHPTLGLDQTAARLNASNDAHAHELSDFEKIYVDEIVGGLELFAHVGVEAMEKLFEESTGQPANITPAARTKHKTDVLALLAGIATHNNAAQFFPTLHVHAMCHAANRWDKRRRLNANTLHDFHHATAAIAYCDVFLTERGMCSFLAGGHMHFERDFTCKVISDSAEALACIRSLSLSGEPT